MYNNEIEERLTEETVVRDIKIPTRWYKYVEKKPMAKRVMEWKPFANRRGKSRIKR